MERRRGRRRSGRDEGGSDFFLNFSPLHLSVAAVFLLFLPSSFLLSLAPSSICLLAKCFVSSLRAIAGSFVSNCVVSFYKEGFGLTKLFLSGDLTAASDGDVFEAKTVNRRAGNNTSGAAAFLLFWRAFSLRNDLSYGMNRF